MSVAWIPRIGSEFAGYKLDSLIGHGGMSIVYRAEHLSLERTVALKLLAPQLSEDEAFRERFLRESRMAAALDHPNVIPIYEAGEENGVFYIAMRYVDGTDLKTLLRQEGPIDGMQTSSIVNQVAGALGAAHAKGLVHRDVKPANILIASTYGIDGSNHVYLSDFGVVKHSASRALTQTGMFVGTAEYASPEQIEGKPLDGRADVYSLGCVLYECLTGAPAYDKDSEVALMYAHLLEPPPSAVEKRPDLPREVDDVISRSMAKARDDRYETPRDLALALRDVFGGVTTAPIAGATQLAAPQGGETVLAATPTGTAQTPAPAVPPAAAAAAPDATSPGTAAPPAPAAPAAPARGGLSRNAKIAIAAVLVALLAAGGAIAGVLLTGGSSSSEESTKLTLISALIPKDLAENCTALTQPRAGAVETAVCSPPADATSFYPDRWELSFFTGASSLKDAYDADKSEAGVTRNSGRCTGVTWGGEGTWDHGPNKPGGRRFCYFDDDNAVIEWTHDKLGQANHVDMLARAQEGGSDHAGLFNWWRFWHHRIGKCVTSVSEPDCIKYIANVQKTGQT